MPNQNVEPSKPPTVKPGSQANEGEGSRTAARNYDKATEQYVKSGRVEPAAKAAEEALEGPEGDSLRAAEAEAKKKSPKDEAHAKQLADEMSDPSEDRE